MDLSDRLDHLIDRPHAIRLANNVAQLAARALSFNKRFVFNLQCLLFFDDRNLLQRARYLLFKQFVVERFIDEIEGAEQKRLMGGVLVRERSHHDDFDRGLKFACRTQEIDAAHVRHLDV